MAKLHEVITDDLAAFIRRQPVFFVASAPLDANGHVNLSPKGLDSFSILSPTSVAYLDLTGSGNETSAHLTENGRITIMFCSFTGPPSILRLFGQGRVVQQGSAEWPELRERFAAFPGVRQIIVADISRVQTSCGFGVPLMEFVSHRETAIKRAESKGEAALAEYRNQKNRTSIDGLPARLADPQA
jgi:hypothetical protein